MRMCVCFMVWYFVNGFSGELPYMVWNGFPDVFQSVSVCVWQCTQFFIWVILWWLLESKVRWSRSMYLLAPIRIRIQRWCGASVLWFSWRQNSTIFRSFSLFIRQNTLAIANHNGKIWILGHYQIYFHNEKKKLFTDNFRRTSSDDNKYRP